MTAEQKVKAKYPDAKVYDCDGVGIAVASPTAGILSEMWFAEEHAKAWEDAASRIEANQ